MIALIAITTCKRLDNIKAFVLDYIDFCNRHAEYDFLVALDGYEEDYVRFCDEWDIPLLFSDYREGVGISKNRIYKSFPNYDYYFFIEDDVELLDGDVFDTHITVFRRTGIPHFSLFHPDGSRQIVGYSDADGYRLVHSLYGGGQFNFFSNEGLRAVGGWHVEFAKYCRFGHTEHSYRCLNTRLCKFPFNVIENCNVHYNYFIWHAPPSVTSSDKYKLNKYGIAEVEQRIMDLKLSYFDFLTPSNHHFNGKDKGKNVKVLDFLENNKGIKYPLLEGKLKRQKLSSYYFNKFQQPIGLAAKIYNLIRSILLNYNNFHLKHLIKKKLGLIKST